jgi:manganese efflux pump family protein
MDILTVIAIGVGLSMDALAVSITSGFVTKGLKFYQALRMALFFGGFQFLMPIIGWFAGLTVRNYIVAFDHWLAFGLLAFIGGKMIYESFEIEKLEEDAEKKSPMAIPNLFLLALATSIDALAVGLSLSFIKVNIVVPSIIIGVITFSISLAGVFIGKKFGHLFEKRMELIGGLVLIGIGVKILLEHLLGK